MIMAKPEQQNSNFECEQHRARKQERLHPRCTQEYWDSSNETVNTFHAHRTPFGMNRE
jgi:hypothetical protein